MYSDNMRVIVINEINKASASTYFVCEGQSPRSLSVIHCYVLSDRNVSLLFRGERDSVDYDAHISVVRKEMLVLLNTFYE
jgi:hypothetical protein